MPSKVDVANRALRMVGATRITSFTQGTPSANAVNDIYDEILKELLASAKWKFAKKRSNLARSSTTPVYEFDYAYAMPSDWLRTIDVHDNDNGTGNFEYREGQVGSQNVLETDSEQVYLTYVYFEQDPNLMTSTFRSALSTALGRDLAVPLSESGTLQTRLESRATRTLFKAMSVDATGSVPKSRPMGSWGTARSGWR
tara:strand:+ start:3234 stop:3827 length:594 start_codon:yes stop_codon:yes gene_type:complete